MSAAKRGGRFSYLTTAPEREQTTPSPEEEAGLEKNADPVTEQDEAPRPKTESSSSGGEGRGNGPAAQELTSVPKGKGRMKQARSQLNVRLPTTLKRQATAKAVLEGRDIGEVVEELLREYLER
jgi:hypothetical protein